MYKLGRLAPLFAVGTGAYVCGSEHGWLSVCAGAIVALTVLLEACVAVAPTVAPPAPA